MKLSKDLFQPKKIKENLLTNKTTKQTIIKNTFWLSASLFLSKVIKYFLVIYAARILGAAEYGTFNFAMSFAALFYIFADLGIGSLISREIAQNREKKINISAGFTLKLVLTFLTFFGIVLISFFVPSAENIKITIWLMAIFTLVNGLTNYLYNCFYGREEMQYQTITEVIEAGIATVLGIYLISLVPKAYILSISYVVSAVVGFLVMLPIFGKKFGQFVKLDFNKKEWKRILSLAWPISLSWACFNILTYTDVTFMGFFKLFEQVGYYSASQKVIALLILPANIIITSVFPTLSKNSKENQNHAQRIFNFQNFLLLGIILPLIFGGYFLAQEVIFFLYGAEYSPSVLILRILIFLTFLTYFSSVLANLLFVYNEQKRTFWAYLVGGIINVILNALFIPKWGMAGAAYATIISSGVSFLGLIYLSLKYTPLKLFNFSFFKSFILLTLASIGMMAFLMEFFVGFSLIIQVIVGAIIYFLLASLIWYLGKKFGFLNI